MIGNQDLRIKPNGRKLIETISLLLVAVLVLGGCSAIELPEMGQGDWQIELIDGYYVTRVNSRAIKLTYKEKEDSLSSSIVLPNYYIKSYQIYKSFICLEGIRTEGRFATEEELENYSLSYYLVNTINNDTKGPFETLEEFKDICSSSEIHLIQEWIIPQPQG